MTGSAVVWPHNAIKANIVKGLHDFIHVQGTIRRQMRCFIKFSLAQVSDIAYVCKVNSVTQGPYYCRQIVIRF